MITMDLLVSLVCGNKLDLKNSHFLPLGSKRQCLACCYLQFFTNSMIFRKNIFPGFCGKETMTKKEKKKNCWKHFDTGARKDGAGF